MKMNNKTYDILKWIALVALPAFCAFYTTIGDIWGFPKVVEVVGTITAFNTFLGILLGVTSTQYKKNNDK